MAKSGKDLGASENAGKIPELENALASEGKDEADSAGDKKSRGRKGEKEEAPAKKAPAVTVKKSRK